MDEQFVGDPLIPVVATCDPARMAAGEPGLPRRFLWRDQDVEVTAALRSWRETGPCWAGSGERYVRKHWYEIVTTLGTMKVYFDRQARGGPKAARWWLFSVRPADTSPAAAITRPTESVAR
ncbi:MAG: putative cytosolic protein [Gemmataceae bacterium]|nr:putative cytosolic protein [Gemmataceae bacterium]